MNSKRKRQAATSQSPARQRPRTATANNLMRKFQNYTPEQLQAALQEQVQRARRLREQERRIEAMTLRNSRISRTNLRAAIAGNWGPAELPHARRNRTAVLSNVARDIPPWLQTKFGDLALKPHQVAASKMLARPSTPGILLFYKVGSGKTLAAVAAAENYVRKTNRRDLRVVVVTNKGLMALFAAEKDRALADDPQRRKKYEIWSARRLHELKDVKKLVDLGKNAIVIIDEVHNLRNPLNDPDPKTGEPALTMLDSVMLVASAAAKRILLSGTPVVNYPMDLGALVGLLDPLRNGTRAVKVWEGGRPTPTFIANFGKLADQNRDVLAGMLACTALFYEPDREEYARHYPKTQYHLVQVPLRPEQVIRQFEIAMQTPGMLRDEAELDREYDVYDENYSAAFLTQPRQCNNFLKLGARTVHPKIDALVKRVVEQYRNGEKCVVYSFFLSRGLEPINRLLVSEGSRAGLRIKPLMLTGPMSSAADAIVADYNRAPSHKVLLISDAGAEGIDLKGTTSVHILEPAFNENKISQVVGRAVRYGSHADSPNKLVNIFRYMAVFPDNFDVPAEVRAAEDKSLLFRMSADEILMRLSKTKQRINDEFLKWLIDISDANLTSCR